MVGSFAQGGSETQALRLARSLARAGTPYGLLLACLDREGPLLAEAEAISAQPVPAFSLRSFHHPSTAGQLWRAARFMREHGVSVVQTFDFYTNVFGMAAAALARVPARIAARRETFGFRTEAQRRVERAAYRLAHAVVVNADAVGRQIVSEGVPARKVHTIYNGIDAGRFVAPAGAERAELLAACGLPPETAARRLVTLVANLRHPVKDHPTFLRAARRVREEVAEAAFVLAGEGELTGEIRELARGLGLGEDIFFTGRCARVAELLAASEVCVLSSRAEGFSNSILEYMAASRPVVATDVGGAREAIVDGETGHLVTAGDDAQMAERLLGLLREPARARAMGTAGRLRVEALFSAEAQLGRTLEIYGRLLARPAKDGRVAEGLGAS
jgi:glycosyltransferase involved in cell wall biosynthesis